jgi:hypothetical protein
MKEYIESNRLVLEADEGMILTDGADLYISKYEFPVGVEKNDIFYEITEAEYEAMQKAMEGEVET